MKREHKAALDKLFYYYHKVPESRIEEFAKRAKLDAQKVRLALKAGVEAGYLRREQFSQETYYAVSRKRKTRSL